MKIELTPQTGVFSATLLVPIKYYDKDWPKCPKCDKKLAPLRLAIDHGVMKDRLVLKNGKPLRVISEQTIWMCEVSCDVEEILSKEV